MSALPSSAISSASTDTVYSADSVEFSPFNPSIFVVGTYQIEKDPIVPPPAVVKDGTDKDADDDSSDEEDAFEPSPTITRYGRCLLYEIDPDGTNLREKQRFDGPAILDVKWSYEKWNNKTTLAIANAEGQVELHGLDEATGLMSRTERVEVDDPKTLCLSLDWSNRRPSSSDASIVVSLSTGSIALLEGESSLSVTSTWKAHMYEAWIAAFDAWNDQTVWTGGDDCVLKGWDLRDGCGRPTFVNKDFEGGVTAIQSHPALPHLFAVGSYDAILRIFDTRSPRQPICTLDVGGGIWRVKWHPTKSSRLLIAAMHGGCCVVDFEGLEGVDGGSDTEVRATVLKRFDGHESMAYGVDWGAPIPSRGEDMVASCSFYDHVVHLWSA